MSYSGDEASMAAGSSTLLMALKTIMQSPGVRKSGGGDVNLLMLIREEELYAERIRDALVFSERKITRNPARLAAADEAERDKRRSLYVRPTSLAEREDEEEELIPSRAVAAASRKKGACAAPLQHQSDDDSSSSFESSVDTEAFINPPVDTRRTVDDNDTLYSAASANAARIEFTYEDLVAAQEGRKQIKARALRRLANLWDENPKLNKEEMLTRLISEYARRYPDEVIAHERRKATSTSATRGVRIRRRGRRR